MASTDTSVARSAPWCPAGRRLHLIDADNLAGSGYPTASQVRAVHVAYRAAVRPGPLDHTIIACSHMSGVEVGLEWPGTQLLWRSGPDGADLALLEAVDHLGDISTRFAGVVLGSGDGIFSRAVRSIRQRDMPAIVVWGHGSLSRELERAASETLRIFAPPTSPIPCSRPKRYNARERLPQMVVA